jgi:hypothetical protein
MAETASELKIDSAATTGGEAAPRYQVHWFRSTIFQIFVVGAVFFCAPGMFSLSVDRRSSDSNSCLTGMYNALSSLGAGGLATPWYANATAAASFAVLRAINTVKFHALTGVPVHGFHVHHWRHRCEQDRRQRIAAGESYACISWWTSDEWHV